MLYDLRDSYIFFTLGRSPYEVGWDGFFDAFVEKSGLVQIRTMF